MKPAIIAASAATVIAAGAGGWYYVDQRIRGEIDARLAAAVDSGRYEALHYEALDYSFDGSIEIEGLHIQQLGTSYRLGTVQISQLDYSEAFPREVTVAIRGLDFPDGVPRLDATGASQLGALLARIADDGSIPLEIDYSHSYAPDASHQLDSSMAVRIPSFVNLDFAGSLRNLPLDELAGLAGADATAGQQDLLPLVEQAEVPALSVSMQDLGLVQAMMEIGAEQFNAGTEDYRNLLVSQARNAYLFLPGNAQQLGMQAGEQLASFLEGGRTLTLTLAPQLNGRIDQLQAQLMAAMFIGDFNRMASLLNFELKAE
jgi:hypothetical protein